MVCYSAGFGVEAQDQPCILMMGCVLLQARQYHRQLVALGYELGLAEHKTNHVLLMFQRMCQFASCDGPQCLKEPCDTYFSAYLHARISLHCISLYHWVQGC